MTNTELLDRLFVLRAALMRITIATASVQVSESSLQQLLGVRDQLNVVIQSLVATDLSASVAGLTNMCATIDASTAQLKSLTAKEADILTAIDYARKAVDAVMPVVGWLAR